MKLPELMGALGEFIGGMEIAPPPESILCQAAETIEEMVHAYWSDGSEFLDAGEPVNAIAAFGYAMGWMDAGLFLGFIGHTDSMNLPELEVSLEETHRGRLVEKARRYERILSDALCSVMEAPEPGSELFAGAGKLKDRAADLLTEAGRLSRQGDLVNALFRCSYGHAWLDTGIRSGFLRILGNRELFTI